MQNFGFNSKNTTQNTEKFKKVIAGLNVRNCIYNVMTLSGYKTIMNIKDH
jgi:hypothetical protein